MSTNNLKSRLVVCAVLALLIASGTALSAVPDTVVQTVTSGSNTYTLRMTKQNFRGPNFEVLAQNSSGGYDPYDPGEVRTFLGTVDEDVSAVVAGYLRTDAVLRTAVFFDRGGTYYTEGDSVVKTNGWAAEAFAFPTSPTVTPGHAGPTTYEWGIGYDVDYSNFTNELQSDLADAVECVEVTHVFMALNFMQCALVKPMVERVIIRTSQQYCPYYGTSGTALLPLLRDEWNNNQSDAVAYCYKVALGTSEIGGGVAYAPGRYSVNDTWGDLEIFYNVGRHEVGHNWSVSDYDGGSPEGATINCGNQYARWCGTAVQDILNYRDNNLLGSGYETNIGTYTAVDISPYASLDAVTIGQGAVTIIDAVANDHDGNADALALTGVFDVVSQNGGLVTLSSGTGPGGRDELQYTPPGVLGFDTFSYQIADSTGMTQTGRVHIMIEEFASFIYQAEDALIVGAQIDQFWVDYINAGGDYVEWTVDAAAAADYDLAWRYSLASGDRPLEIKVNGQVVDPSLSFPATGSFGTWDFTAPLRVALNAGANTIRATAIGSSGANVDYLKVTETVDTSGPQTPYFYYDPTYKPFAIVGQGYAETLADTANDPDLNETLTFSKLTGPDWLDIASDGTLSGTPTAGDMGTSVFTVRVTDSTELTADTTLVIDVYEKTGEATYEAEDAVYEGATFSTYHAGYTGTGYIDYANSSGDYILWTVNASETGLASLEFRYALGSGDRPLEITVNGQVVDPSLSFPSTGDFTNWDYTAVLMVNLNAGDNTVQATAIGSSGANVDHLKVGFYSTTGGEDNDPPTPNPATFAVAPAADSDTAISMTATTGSDATPPVEYYFDETSGNPGGTDSGWQTSPSYTDTGLDPSTQYTYTVTMRDSVTPTPNMGTPSTPANATTNSAPDTDPPTPNPATWAVPPAAESDTAISMTATTGSDATGPVEYYFDETSGNPGGTDSGWQTSPSYTDTGLSPSTQYTYTVQMRDAVTPTPNVGTASSPASATTDPASSVLPWIEGFESGDFVTMGWTTTGTPSVTGQALYSGLYGAKIPGGSSIEVGIDTTGHAGIHVKYRRETTALDAGEELIVDWYDGSSWTVLEAIEDCLYSDGLQDKICGAGADNNANFKIRFRNTADKTNETAYIDDIEVTEVGAPPDTDPPTPNPATFAVPPAADGSYAISMTATTGSDASEPVEYYFAETSGNPGGSDSGWQTSPSYTDSGLNPSTQYTYTVQMRDSAPTPNVGTASSPASATTEGGCTPTDMHIEAVVCGELGGCAPASSNGQATVTIYDDCGNPVVNALVDGTFTGDFEETFYDVLTDANGQAVFTTAGCVKKPAFSFTVIDVDHATLPYDTNDDLTTGCSG